MPLARYFLWVSGALLTLLLIADLLLPKLPVVEGESARLPAIRIHSDQKWPERVVYDTRLPSIIHAQPTSIAASTSSAAPTNAAEISTKTREAFALAQPSDPKQLRRSDTKRQETKLQRQRRIASRPATRRALLAAPQPQFGWSGARFW